jgi:hypothetical protein
MTHSPHCSGEPISWLRLERYHLDEVDGAERVRVADHVAACATCAACLASLTADDAVALPALPEPAKGAAKPGIRRALARGVFVFGGGLALAALALLGLGNAWRSGRLPSPHAAPGVKGDAVAFSLVRDDDERIVEAGGLYRDGDRFKAIVTCPPGASFTFDLVVFDAQGAGFPLSPASGFVCGNDVPLPGAFRLTGNGEEAVCVVWTEDGSPDRSMLARANDGAGLGERALCKTLTALPSSREP